MEKLIAVDELIKKAKEREVDFGKGSPYNRLRYYTKIGWLPHMIRKKGAEDSTKGHYPLFALDNLLFIEKMKADNKSNEEITKSLNLKNKLQSVSEAVSSPGAKSKIATYLTLFLLLLVFASEIGILPFGKVKSRIIQQTIQTPAGSIADSGSGLVPTNSVEVFIKSDKVRENSKVYVSFNGNYSPAARFWVSRKIPFEGFYVELDAPVSQSTEFGWWLSN